MLFGEFFRQHAEEKLAPKTIERYRELAAYLAPELLAMPLGEITPLHLSREWNRLLKSGGRHRKTKQARPLSAKTVRHIAGLVSSAFAQAGEGGGWSLRIPLLGASLRFQRSTGALPPHPCAAGFGLRICDFSVVHGNVSGKSAPLLVHAVEEVLALRWSDIQDGRAIITRSLTQTREILEFKGTKTERPRDVKGAGVTRSPLSKPIGNARMNSAKAVRI